MARDLLIPSYSLLVYFVHIRCIFISAGKPLDIVLYFGEPCPLPYYQLLLIPATVGTDDVNAIVISRCLDGLVRTDVESC